MMLQPQPDTLTAITEDALEWASTLIHSRHTTLPKRLHGPGPGHQHKQTILQTAAAAPDHGRLLPWRFVEIGREDRPRLAEAFAQALLERDPSADSQDLDRAREKAYRSPWLMLAIARVHGGDPDIDAAERLVSAGCAIQNILLSATALGYGSALTSGKALKSQVLRQLFNLHADEEALCFISIGHAESDKHHASLARPPVSDYFSILGGPTG